MNAALAAVPQPLRARVEGQWRELAPHLADLQPGEWLAALPRVFAGSDFVAHACAQRPELLRDLVGSGDLARAYAPGEITARVAAALADAGDETTLKRRLRRLRLRELVRIAWRDLAGRAGLDEVVATLSEFADACMDQALTRLHAWAVDKYGAPRGADGGAPQALVVLGLGKLGGQELNFSSDVDLIFAYPEDGETQGARALSNHEFFIRLGQALINALAEPTADGFVFRVDMRLRPNGASGPLALSFDAMEQYYQTHGREWERYALIKARACAGARAAGAELLARLRPFVFRRYLDYGALEAIRGMKTLIERELLRKGMRDNIKLGPGGIREIEFIGQALQLIRGGREPALQARAIQAVLPLLAAGGQLTPPAAAELNAAYVFLRNVEHRLQMAADRQTHGLPADESERTRLAGAMGFGGWNDFHAELRRHTRKVHGHFEQMFAAPQRQPAEAGEPGLLGVWLDTVDADTGQRLLRAAGYEKTEAATALLRGLREGPAYGAFSGEGRARMDRLMPLLLAAAGLSPDPPTTLARLVNLLEAIGRRTAYLALLIENPMALSQLVKLCSASPWIAGWISRHPIVLDELLDPRSLYEPLTRAALESELRGGLAHIPAEDLETQMEALREFRHGAVLRVAAADIALGPAPEQVSTQLAVIAEVTLAQCLELAREALAKRHGRPACPRTDTAPGFAVVAYGKLGSLELGYGSDLDMIFLYEGCEDGVTTGPRGVPNELFFARLGQRLIHMLTVRTPAGVLYEVDMRLRPSGQSGPLVTSREAFRDYQRTHAWTWEHQALVRARAVAGAPELRRWFEQERREVLGLARDPAKLRREVLEMRAKMAASLAPQAPDLFDVKHDRGGIVDIEFMVQYWVLRWAREHPGLTRHTDNIHILEALRAEGLLATGQARSLVEAFRRYLSVEHRQKLMERGSQVDRAELGDWPDEVRQIWQEVFEE